MQNVVIEGDVFDDSRTKSLSIDDENVDIRYWNSYVKLNRNDNIFKNRVKSEIQSQFFGKK